MKNRKLLLIVSLVLALTMSLGGTLAYLQDTDEAVNVMTLGNVKIEQTEIGADGDIFKQGQPLYPAYPKGDEMVGTVVKKVSVENTGSSDAHIRTWIAFEAGEYTNHEDLEALIKITFDESVKGQETWLPGVYEIDGQKYCVAYFVYDAVEPDAIVKSLERFYMVSAAGNKEVEQFGNTYEVLVLSQAVQTNNFVDAAEALTAAFGDNHPWEGKDIAELPTKVVKTAADLKTALEEGGTTVVLGADIDMDADNTIIIAAGKSARLDLAGHTLSGVADGTGNCEMFLVKGNLTVNDGNLEMSATVNQAWDAMSTIFDVTAGGVLNLNGVTAKNLGGTDMAFVAHLNNWGEVTLNVNNCNLQSNYVAVRVFNSGYDMNNVSIYDSTLTAKNVLWVHNYTAADFKGDAEKAAKQAALLNLDYENGTNTFNGYVRLGMTNPEYPGENNVETVGVSTGKDLQKELGDGKDVVLTADIKAEAATTAPYGNKYAFKMDGGVIDGNGNELYMECYGDDYGIMTTGGTIKNLTIKEGCRAIMIMYPQEDVILDNVNIGGDGVLYAINTGEAGASGVDLIVTNSTIKGWTSFSNIESASFTNVKFEQGTYYNNIYGRVFKPYVNTTIKNCSFIKAYNLDLSALGNGCKVTIENCTVDGQPLTADIMTIPATDAEYDTCTFTVDLPSWATSIEDCVIFK